MKRLFKAYGDLLSVIYKEAPIMVVLTFIMAITAGLVTPLTIFVNEHIFNDGLAIAKGAMTFAQYTPYLVLFIIASILPSVISLFTYGYVEQRSMLILRTAYKGRMLQKIKKMKYEHFENEVSAEIIDKAYNRAENSARHMFPMYVFWTLSSLVASIGTLWYLFNIKWWLILTVLIPFIAESYLASKNNYNIYDEIEKYWNKERQYGILAGFLKSRYYVKENRLFNSSDYLIDTYRTRLNERNKDYEKYYLKHLKRHFTKYNITKIAPIANVLLLLYLYLNGQMNIGIFIALSLMMFGSVYMNLNGSTIFFRASGYHLNFFDYYDKYFNLSEDEAGNETELPKSFDIEFRDVWFKYPGTEKDILKGLSFHIKNNERVSFVGANGEGKSTMIKLLLGLFTPDSGEILVGGRSLYAYSNTMRTKIFGPVFQDFVKYSISLKENIGIGDIDKLSDEKALQNAMNKGKVNEFLEKLENKENTLLGRDFEGGVDLSGGQWQRVAIARAFMGDKPVILLDEPTSQLDPIAESQLYYEFAEMAEHKTAIFITHRLASTMITDRIFVISDGKITESGTHNELMNLGGLYAKMFDSQRQWYSKGTEQEVNTVA
jgi:ATP-binding cassette subfamily B protein